MCRYESFHSLSISDRFFSFLYKHTMKAESFISRDSLSVVEFIENRRLAKQEAPTSCVYFFSFFFLWQFYDKSEKNPINGNVGENGDGATSFAGP